MTKRGLVLDIETAPAAAALTAVGQTARGAEGRVWLHQLVAVSLFGFVEEPDGRFGNFDLQSLLIAPVRGQVAPGEAKALKSVDASLAALGDDGLLISFNGRRHDLPFLRVRRRRHGLFKACALDRFFGDGAMRHIDMMEVLAADGLRWPSLDDACAAFDIPHLAHRAISSVSAAVRKSETDVLATFLLYLLERAARAQSKRCLLDGWTALAGWCLSGPDSPHRRQFATAATARAAITARRST